MSVLLQLMQVLIKSALHTMDTHHMVAKLINKKWRSANSNLISRPSLSAAPLHPILRKGASLKITELGRKQKQVGNCLAGSQGLSWMLLFTLTSGWEPASGGRRGSWGRCQSTGAPLPPPVTSAGERLLAHPHTALNDMQQAPLIRGRQPSKIALSLR